MHFMYTNYPPYLRRAIERTFDAEPIGIHGMANTEFDL